MDCDKAMALISALIDHEIDPEDRVRLDAHSSACPTCRAAVEGLQNQDADLRRGFAPRRQAVAATIQKVAAGLRAASAEVNHRMGRFPMTARWFPNRGRLALALTSAAAVVALAFVFHHLWQRSPGRTASPDTVAGVAPFHIDPANFDALTARPRSEAPAPTPLKVGEAIQTRAGERRRVGLPDGSILYINENTGAQLSAPRQLRLFTGEVFLEVSPRQPNTDGSTFLIQTPSREITALGTRFAVKAEKAGTGVVVTQGKVKVSGLADVVQAGQQVLPGSAEPKPAPRASYVLDWARDLMVAAESPLVPRSEHCGGALIALDPWGQEAKLSLRKVHIDVHIEDGFARTTIDQTYFNHNAWRMEGTFYFPLPADASLSRLAMYVANGKECTLMEGGMAERDYARQVFEQIMYTQRDPALLEWLDGSTFKMRVFPLEGRQEKRIILSYTQKLDAVYGRAAYRFPSGHTMQLVKDWSFEARVKGGAAFDWRCGSHDLKAVKAGADLVLTAQAQNIKPDKDVTLGIAEDISMAPAARFSSAVHEGSHYLMLRYRPTLPGQPQRQRRDWVFLFESAGDRDPLLARVQIEVIRTLLSNAEHDDTFAIVTTATRVQTLAKPQAATGENVKSALEALEKVHLIGALDLAQAINHVKPMLHAARNPYLVHVGSGIAALGERKEDVLAKRLPAEVPYVGVGVGKRWSRNFMKTAAERSSGAFTQINPDEPIAWRAFELFSVLNTPRLHNVRVVDNAEKAVFLSHNGSLAQGEELCAIARTSAGQALPQSVTITGTLDGKTYTEELPVAAVAANAAYLPRTWAKLEIDRLLTDSEKNKKQIIELSKAMYVMTPFTSLLVLENEAMYKQYNVDRGRKDHWAMYNCPARIPTVYEPDPSQGIDWRFAPRNVTPAAQRLPAETVLSTVLVRMPARFFAAPNQYGQQAWTVLDLQRLAYAMPDFDSDVQQLDLLGRTLGEVKAGSGGRSSNRTTMLRTESGPADIAGLPQAEQAARFAGFRNGTPIGRDLNRALQANGGAAMPPMAETMDATRRRGAVPADRAEREPRLQSRASDARADIDLLAGMPSGRDFLDFKQLREQPGERKQGRKRAKESDGEMAETIVSRLLTGYGHYSLVYQRPAFGGDERIFSDLLSYAPGMNTSSADVQAVLEAEATVDPTSAPGTVEAAAQKLIERARAATWQALTIPESDGQPAFTVVFDGSGRYTYERVLPDGLLEKVVCDGKTLLHLYPELGIGARRSVTRFHRAEFADLVSEALPPVEDLARGHDIKCIGERTVAIQPRNPQAKGPDGKPASYTVVHLTFAADGWLAERVVLEMPGNKTLYRETFSADSARLFDADGKLVTERKSVRKEAQAPELASDLKKLVVMPLPYRTWQHVWATKANGKNYQNMDEETGLALIGSALYNNMAWQAWQVYQQRFHNKGVRQVGFHTLMAASGIYNQNQQFWQQARNEHPQEPLTKYLALFNPQRQPNTALGDLGAPRDGFLQRLAAFRDMYVLWNSGKALEGDDARRNAERDRALEYVRHNKTSVHGWAVLSLLREKLADHKPSQKPIAEACKLFEQTPGLAYAARYEYARSLFKDGQAARARSLWLELYNQTLQDSALPLIDTDFRQAVQIGKSDPSFRDLVRKTAAALLAQKRRLSVISLASQCRQIDEPALAEDLLADALKGLTDQDRVSTTLAGIEFYWQSGRQAKADELLQALLTSGQGSQNAALWHLASSMATQQRKLGRAAVCLDRALEIEYRNLPRVINLQAVRSDYGRLLNDYQQVAFALSMLDRQPDKEFVIQVVRAADRWRALDADNALACQTAARILKSVGAGELAWDYLTTPCALHPNEAAPHLSMAQTLRQDGDIEMANRAYTMAFNAEPTNVQILWEQAQMLQQAGRHADALNIYRKIADGTWPPAFQGIKQQARWQLGVR